MELGMNINSHPLYLKARVVLQPHILYSRDLRYAVRVCVRIDLHKISMLARHTLAMRASDFRWQTYRCDRECARTNGRAYFKVPMRV